MTPSANTPANINTSLSLDKVLAQVAQDNKDLPGAVAAIQDAGTDEALQNVAVVSQLLGQTVTSLPAPVQTLDVATGVAAPAATDATATASSAAASATSSGKNNGGNGKGNNNGANANADANANTNNAGNGKGNANNNNKRRATVFFA